MSTDQSTIDYILDQLSGVENVSARKMFGEYTVYASGLVVALVCDDTLFVKLTEAGVLFVGEGADAKIGQPFPGAKPWLLIDDDRIEDREWLRQLIEFTVEQVPLPRVKKKKSMQK